MKKHKLRFLSGMTAAAVSLGALAPSLPACSAGVSLSEGSAEQALEEYTASAEEDTVDADAAYVSKEAPETYVSVEINSMEDFLTLAENCHYDSWSLDKAVVLNVDLDFTGEEFTPIAIFSGTFDGQGHTLSGISITDSVENTGVFGIIESTGIVSNLNVEGVMEPSGYPETIGGIAGTNYGIISNCTFSGDITADAESGGIVGRNAQIGIVIGCSTSGTISVSSGCGGIVGYNEGTISSCENDMEVNTTYQDTTPSLDELDDALDTILQSESLLNTGSLSSDSDIGGIAGFSSGVITSCTNRGAVGYEHVGYNVGGIVGRSSGYLADNTNYGTIHGRKDVGGIAGQLQPYLEVSFTEETLDELDQELDTLADLIQAAVDNADSYGTAVTNHLTNITGLAEIAEDSVADMAEEAADTIDDVASDLNTAGDKMQTALNIFAAVGDEFGDYMDGIGSVFSDMDDFGFSSFTSYLSSLSSSIKQVLSSVNSVLSSGDSLDLAGDAESLMELLQSYADQLQSGSGSESDSEDGNSEDTEDTEDTDDTAADETTSETETETEIVSATDPESTETASEETVSTTDGSTDNQDAAETADDTNIAAEDTTNTENSNDTDGSTTEKTTTGAEDKTVSATSGDTTADDTNDTSDAAGSTVSADDTVSAENTGNSGSGSTGDTGSASSLSDAEKELNESTSAGNGDGQGSGEEDLSEEEMAMLLENISSEISSYSSASEELSAAAAELEEQAQSAQDDLSSLVETSSIAQTLSSVQDNLETMQSSLSSLGSLMSGLDDAVPDLSGLTDTLEEAGAALSDADDLSLSISTAMNVLASIDLQISGVSDTMRASGDNLYESIHQLTDEMESLNQEIHAMGSSASGDLEAIIEQFNVVTDTLIDTAESLMGEDGDEEDEAVEDISEEDMEDTFQGRSTRSVNYGTVEADINVGGIVGVIGVEYSLDPELDIEVSGSATLNYIFQAKCIVDNSINYGTLITRSNYAGGIAGNMEMGLVSGCENYGTLDCDGKYIGGIAGYSAGTIRNSAAKCEISGTQYVGGIVGYGTTIRGNLAMVNIEEGTQNSGAIAGAVSSVDASEISDNYYYSTDSYGIGSVSYTGIAEGVSYEALLAMESVPEAFGDLVLSFYAEDELIGVLTSEYGGSISESDLPEIPEKEGFYGLWSRTDYSCVTADEVIEAEYIRYTTLLASGQTRESGLPILEATGLFRSEDALTVTEAGAEGDELERWTITIPEDGLGTHEIRFLIPEDVIGGTLYLVADGERTKLQTETYGNYLTFEVSGNEITLALEDTMTDSTQGKIKMALLIAVIAAAVVLLIILIRRRLRRARRK